MNRFWVNGLFTGAEPSSPEDNVIAESLQRLAQRDVTGNDMTAIEFELRRTYRAGRRKAKDEQSAFNAAIERGFSGDALQ